ncbi:MAG: tetratricopeptide repeat protein [Alphaproteobacteria bacterium]|nr:tetratricopeptide repeat protein [Alphaproteobacteria bacterium]
MQAHTIDLEAELSAGAEAEQHDTNDFASRPRMRVDNYVERLPAATRKKHRKVVTLIKRAVKASDNGDNSEGARLAHEALGIAPEMALTNHVMGLMLLRLGRLSRALEFLERAWKIDPKDPEIYQKLGLVAWKLDMLDAAEKFYRLQCQIAPSAIDGILNLSGVLRDAGKFEEAIEILRTTIFQHQDNPELWNSLGSVISESGDPAQAATFYTEALRLRSDFARAHNNMANVYELLGEPKKALPHYEEALKDPADAKDRATMLHGRSMVMLAAGMVQDGWVANESRLDPNRDGATLFAMNCPMWDGEDLEQIRGKTLVWIGEQGLGDEVLFMNQVHDLLEAIGPEGELRIVCEYRLLDLVARSFPQAKVFNHLSTTIEGRDVRAAPKIDADADFWTPMATPLRALRPSLDSFPETPGYLVPDPDRQTAFKTQLDTMGSGLKVGILWKSLKMNARRARFFSAFDAWKPVLDVPNVDFINLQYGEVDEELALARDRFGVTVHQPQDIDLKMDLDGVAALSSACDLIIGPMNATTNLAAASGANVWFIHARSSTWTLLGAGRSMWYPQTRSFFGEGFQDWDNTMRRVADELAALPQRS